MGRRIIVVMIEPPLPFGSAASRWYYVLLKGLVERGHDVTAFAANCRETDTAEVGRWFSSTSLDLRLFEGARTSGVQGKLQTIRRPHSYLFGADLRTQLGSELSRPFDILHCEQHWSGWLALQHTTRTLLNVHYLYDIDLGRSRVINLRDAIRLRGERQLLRRFPALSAVTPRVARRVAEIAPNADVRCLPLALDASLYPFAPARTRAPETPPTVGLIGSFAWGPSYTAARRLVRRLWPDIRRQSPSARLLIVGRSARQALAGLALPAEITVLEDVPDALPHFASLDVMLYAPERGSGAKVKVLEAFALGTPVVTTAEGVEGIDALDGIHAGIAEDDAGLISRTVALLGDAGRADRQRRAARALVERHCDLAAALDGVEVVHDAIVRRHRAAAAC